jgi:hypothetical protein
MHLCTYVFPWRLEMRMEVDVGCGRKRFLDQISNPHIEDIMIGFGHSFLS